MEICLNKHCGRSVAKCLASKERADQGVPGQVRPEPLRVGAADPGVRGQGGVRLPVQQVRGGAAGGLRSGPADVRGQQAELQHVHLSRPLQDDCDASPVRDVSGGGHRRTAADRAELRLRLLQLRLQARRQDQRAVVRPARQGA